MKWGSAPASLYYHFHGKEPLVLLGCSTVLPR